MTKKTDKPDKPDKPNKPKDELPSEKDKREMESFNATFNAFDSTPVAECGGYCGVYNGSECKGYCKILKW